RGLAAKTAADTPPADQAGEDGAGPDAGTRGAAERADQPVAEELTTPAGGGSYERPRPARGVTPIGSLTRPGRAVAEGRVHTVEIRPVEHNTVLACDIEDATGQLTALFYGRSHIAGLRPGAKVRLRGQVGIRENRPVMINPAYELLAPGEGEGRDRGRRGDS
ncbi:MAG: OB-fold nucleic acid binding domain-containing protein, partial [Streptosporangiaceae bacterium]